jgi:hypothetical protein
MGNKFLLFKNNPSLWYFDTAVKNKLIVLLILYEFDRKRKRKSQKGSK